MMTGLPCSLTIEDTVRDLLIEMTLTRCRAETLTMTDDLYQAGLSSLGTVDLMLAVEDRFGIEFTNEWLNRRTFASIAAIGKAVRSLQESAS